MPASDFGIYKSTHPWDEGADQVNHYYYGLVRDDVVRWHYDPSMTGRATPAPAAEVWERRDEITAIVARHGGAARVRVTVNEDGTWTVADYDWGKWSEILAR